MKHILITIAAVLLVGCSGANKNISLVELLPNKQLLVEGFDEGGKNGHKARLIFFNEKSINLINSGGVNVTTSYEVNELEVRVFTEESSHEALFLKFARSPVVGDTIKIGDKFKDRITWNSGNITEISDAPPKLTVKEVMSYRNSGLSEHERIFVGKWSDEADPISFAEKNYSSPINDNTGDRAEEAFTPRSPYYESLFREDHTFLDSTHEDNGYQKVAGIWKVLNGNLYSISYSNNNELELSVFWIVSANEAKIVLKDTSDTYQAFTQYKVGEFYHPDMNADDASVFINVTLNKINASSKAKTENNYVARKTYPLHDAVKEGSVEKIKSLLSKSGTNVNERDENGKTSLDICRDLFSNAKSGSYRNNLNTIFNLLTDKGGALSDELKNSETTPKSIYSRCKACNGNVSVHANVCMHCGELKPAR